MSTRQKDRLSLDDLIFFGAAVPAILILLLALPLAFCLFVYWLAAGAVVHLFGPIAVIAQVNGWLAVAWGVLENVGAFCHRHELVIAPIVLAWIAFGLISANTHYRRLCAEVKNGGPRETAANGAARKAGP